MQKLIIPQKWRPSQAHMVITVVLVLLSLPLAGLLAARLTSNQFVRETESNLLSQAALFAETFTLGFEKTNPKSNIGVTLRPQQLSFWQNKFLLIRPKLDVSEHAILPPAETAVETHHTISKPYLDLSADLTALAERSQRATLTAYRVMDFNGSVFAGTGDLGDNLAHLPEVIGALRGDVQTSLRLKFHKDRSYPLSSLSRDTQYRVFVAWPVIVNQRVIGAILLSRTPLSLAKFLYQERMTLMIVATFVLLSAALIGFLFWRLITSPVRALNLQSHQVAMGQKDSLQPIPHYGTRELAALGQSVLSMSQRLTQKSEALQTYTAHVTHELKSPVTSIAGAIELLSTRGKAMKDDQRERFLKNIQDDCSRMSLLLEKLRELARADAAESGQETHLAPVIKKLGEEFPEIKILNNEAPSVMLPLSFDHAVMIFSHMLQNSVAHGATQFSIRLKENGGLILIEDDGEGISDGNLSKVTEAFFTTNRENGGTGMGLAIAQSLLSAHNGQLIAVSSQKGACFEIRFDR